MTTKRVFFFAGDEYLRFDTVTRTVDPKYPRKISGFWPGLFTQDIEAAVSWHSGKVYLFSGSEYCRYDILLDAVDAGYPKPIAGNWPGLTGTGFENGIDAAVNWGDGKAYFFKGNRYIRLTADVTSPSDKRMDAGYPKPITGNWPGVAGTGFENGIDAAINWGNGQVFWFKDDQYLGLRTATKSVDPGFPVPIADHWPGVYSTGISAAVAWPLAESGALQVPTDRAGWSAPTPQGDGTNRVGEFFRMEADFVEGPHPTMCAAGEYRQYVRGAFMRLNPVSGLLTPVVHQLPNPRSTPAAPLPPRPMLPMPPAGAASDNFLEDGNSAGNWLYGHRRNPAANPGPHNQFLPDRANGCEFRGTDNPGYSNVPGTFYFVWLDFRGQAVDAATEDEVLQTSDWSVAGMGIL